MPNNLKREKNDGLMSELVQIDAAGDGIFRRNENGVVQIGRTGDSKAEFIDLGGKTLVYVKSSMGYPAYYPLYPAKLEKPVKAVLMDLDGTSVHSEKFWIGIIQKTIASLLEEPEFELEECDFPYVSGHSVSEHLKYCINKYCPEKSLEQARKIYFEHTHFEMSEMMEGRGLRNAFEPAPGLKDFLLLLKASGIKIGLVTSGLYEKAWPEILSAFHTMGLGDPGKFYDSIITAGYPLKKGSAGTLGELTPKPHPWLYAETCRVGLGIDFDERSHVVGIEDSGAGICSVRLAGFTAIGMSGGNIRQSGALGLCNYFCDNFREVLDCIDK